MELSQTAISRAVRRHLADTRTSQKALGETLGVTQTCISARLNGRTKWSYDDVLALAAIGIPELKPLLMIGADA